jgi:hypothetical protein
MSDQNIDTAFLEQLRWADGFLNNKAIDAFLENIGGMDGETSGEEFQHCFEGENDNGFVATMEKLGVQGGIIKTPTKPTRPTRPPRTPPSTTTTTTTTTSSSSTTTTTTTITNAVDGGRGLTASGRVLLKLAAMRKPETMAAQEDNMEGEGKLQTWLSQIMTETNKPKEVNPTKKEKRPRPKPKITTPPINSIKRTKRSQPTTTTTTQSSAAPAAVNVTVNIAVPTPTPPVAESKEIIDVTETTDEEDNNNSDSSSSDEEEDDDDDDKEYHGVREHKMSLMYDAVIMKNGVSHEILNYRNKRQAAKAADRIRVALYGSVAKPLNFPENMRKYLTREIPGDILKCVGENLCTKLKRAIKNEN